MEAEPSLGYAFNIAAPFRTAALMSVAGMSEGKEKCWCFTAFKNSQREEGVWNLTSVVLNIPCKLYGTFHVCFGGLDKLTFPLK